MNSSADTERTPPANREVFSTRAPRKLFYRDKPTMLMAGDRVCIKGCHVTFLRGSQNMKMEIANGLLDDKIELSMVPNAIVAEQIVELLALVLELEVKRIHHDVDLVTFEFS